MASTPSSPCHQKIRWRASVSPLLLFAALLLLVGLLSGCTTPTPAPTAQSAVQPVDQPVKEEAVVPPAADPTKPPEPTSPPAPTDPPAAPTTAPEPAVDPLLVQVATTEWEKSPHGNTYDLGKGPNTYCSRCHSPQNWDPASSVGPPPNCVTCKFPQDPELRNAKTMAFVEEKDWMGIGCVTCHVMADGNVTAQNAWFNPLTKEHEPVATINELCGKCHATTKGVSASGGRGVEHGIILGGSAHLNWAGALPQTVRPDQCTDCHNPHSAEPKDCQSCHKDVLTEDTHMKGTNAEHANVTCMACHDASGLEVGPIEAKDGKWVTILSSVSRSGEKTVAYQHSHSIQWQVACDRCHFKDNPAGLSVLTADGAQPTAQPSGN